jgi:TRAP transporter TAXI family solute receptor
MRQTWNCLNRVMKILITTSIVAFGASIVQSQTTELPKHLTAGSSSLGALYHVWTTGWANVVGDALKVGIDVSATSGAAANVRLVSEGQIDVGMATMGTVHAGLNGTGWTDGVQYDNVRVLFPVYQSFIQAWTLSRDGMTNWRDLDGQVFSPGTAGGTAEVESPRIFELLSISPSRVVRAGYEDANGMLKDGLVSAVAASTGAPGPAIVSLTASHDITVLEFTLDDAEAIVADMPYFAVGHIPAGTYEGQESDILTLALWNVMLATDDMPDEVAYQLVKATFESHDRLTSMHPTSKDTLAENIRNIRAPLHPGAVRYYNEIGIELSAVQSSN